MKDNEFRCAICKQVFTTELTDEEAEMQLAEDSKGSTRHCRIIIFAKLLEILKNHFLSSARFRSVCQPHYITKMDAIKINEQTTTKVKYPKKFS